jgi:hypothetical protein
LRPRSLADRATAAAVFADEGLKSGVAATIHEMRTSTGMCFFASLLDCNDFGGDLALTRVVKPEVHAEGQKTS